LIFVACAVAAATLLKCWYPVRLPNDYAEFPDAIKVEGESVAGGKVDVGILSREDYIACSKKHLLDRDSLVYGQNGSPDDTKGGVAAVQIRQNMKQSLSQFHCPDDIYLKASPYLRGAVPFSGVWQSQVGRLLYHHSYLAVPAVHFLNFGFSTPIPALYGTGNTLFHALLLKLTAPTLTAYFNTFPVAQAVGIVAIALMVLYLTQSWYAFSLAILASTTALMAIGYAAVFLAPGFSPLRYLGLALQVAAMFFYARRQSKILGLAGLCASAMVSIFWNTEYAFLGLVGQFMVLMTVDAYPGVIKRLMLAAALAACAGASLVMMGSLSHGFLHTIQAGLFNVGVPQLSKHNFVFLIVGAMAVVWGGFLCAQKFHDKAESAGRVSLLPLAPLIMIKYLYNPTPVHFFYCFVFLAPLALVYCDWRSVRRLGPAALDRFYSVGSYFSLCAVAVSLLISVEYYQVAREWQSLMITPYVHHTWSGLGETFTTATPADPVVERMTAVRSQIKDGDQVLFLSPLDHLMSFYANPAHYCGHFELLTNLVTTQSIQSVLDCVHNSPQALVVYDTALETPMPNAWEMDYYDKRAFEGKHMVLYSAYKIMEELRPEMVLVAKIGPLSFYRHPASGTASPILTK